MLKYAVLGFAGLALAAAGVCVRLAVADPPSPPGMRVDSGSRDVGVHGQGGDVPVTFTVTNGCREVVRLETADKSCSCLSAKVGSAELKPGEQTTVTLTWSSGNARGGVRATVTLAYRAAGGAAFPLQLEVNGTVEPDVACTADVLTFSAGSRTADLGVTPGRCAAMQVKRVTCTHAAFRARYDADRGKVLVEFDPAAWPPGGVPAMLTIETTCPHDDFVRVVLAVDEAAK